MAEIVPVMDQNSCVHNAEAAVSASGFTGIAAGVPPRTDETCLTRLEAPVRICVQDKTPTLMTFSFDGAGRRHGFESLRRES